MPNPVTQLPDSYTQSLAHLRTQIFKRLAPSMPAIANITCGLFMTQAIHDAQPTTRLFKLTAITDRDEESYFNDLRERSVLDTLGLNITGSIHPGALADAALLAHRLCVLNTPRDAHYVTLQLTFDAHSATAKVSGQLHNNGRSFDTIAWQQAL